MTHTPHESFPSLHDAESSHSADQARRALEQRRMLLIQGNLTQSIDAVYESSDTEGILALERARGVIEQQGISDSTAFAAAQRQIELTLEAGEWTDEVREAAVGLNREQRRAEGVRPVSFEEAVGELKAYKQALKDGAKRDGDEWLDNQANALGYSLNAASRGDIDGINGTLSHVEGMLKSTLNLSDQERGADELRGLRDALFTKKQELHTLQIKNDQERQQREQREPEIVEARQELASIFVQPEVSTSVEQVTTVDVRAAQQTGFEEVQRAFDALPAEEKKFRNGLAQVRDGYGIASISELGMSADDMNSLDDEQKRSLSEVFQRYNRQQMRLVGFEQMQSAKTTMVQEIQHIIHADGGAAEQQDIDVSIDQVEEVETAGPNDLKLESLAPAPSTDVKRDTMPSVEKAAGSSSADLVRAVGSYFNGASGQEARAIVQSIATEQGIDSKVLYDRLRRGEIADTPDSQQATTQLLQEGARANSLAWGSVNNTSELGKAAEVSRQLLEHAIRSLLE